MTYENVLFGHQIRLITNTLLYYFRRVRSTVKSRTRRLYCILYLNLKKKNLVKL